MQSVVLDEALGGVAFAVAFSARPREMAVPHASAREAALRLIDVARYVIANPKRAGLVERVGDYPYWDAIWLDGVRG